ncbi:MAG: nucleotidyltransferase family protein [Clostridiales Family XIII bacterium]|jgi:predicted nucleotidyltransferase|nr:nucleotidyltransferase family protein [Clostridiales Family XIII bacterium]
MADVVGIICEYNPFHEGHAYQLKEAVARTGAGAAVCVMSGDFVQRGEPAIMSKWIRAKAAVAGGADLVIELPFLFACNNAEWFARGAVRILDGLAVVGALSFGSETGRGEEIYAAAAHMVSNPAFEAAVRAHMQQGVSYPRARAAALREVGGPKAARAVRGPNDSLAAEYCRQLIQSKSRMEICAVQRLAGVPTASEIRGRMQEAGEGTVYPEQILPLLAYRLAEAARRGAPLSGILSATEGLENRLAAAVRKAGSYEEAVRLTKSKRYTRTRVCRLMIHTLLGITKADAAAADGALYARVLAFSEKGAALLKRIRKAGGQMPVFTNASKVQGLTENQRRLLAIDALAADLYRVLSKGALGGFDDTKRNPNSA